MKIENIFTIIILLIIIILFMIDNLTENIFNLDKILFFSKPIEKVSLNKNISALFEKTQMSLKNNYPFIQEKKKLLGIIRNENVFHLFNLKSIINVNEIIPKLDLSFFVGTKTDFFDINYNTFRYKLPLQVRKSINLIYKKNNEIYKVLNLHYDEENKIFNNLNKIEYESLEDNEEIMNYSNSKVFESTSDVLFDGYYIYITGRKGNQGIYSIVRFENLENNNFEGVGANLLDRCSSICSTSFSTDREETRIVAVGFGDDHSIILSKDCGKTFVGLGKTIFSVGNKVIWSGEKFLAVGMGTNCISYSYNGENWVGLGMNFFDIKDELVIDSEGKSICYNGFIYVCVGYGKNTIGISYDGINWSTIENFLNFSIKVNDICWNGEKFVIVGGNYTNDSIVIAYSYDGVIWEKGNLIFSEDDDVFIDYSIENVSWDYKEKQFWAFGINQYSDLKEEKKRYHIAITSIDGINWYNNKENEKLFFNDENNYVFRNTLKAIFL
jgi:hypothetical protein